MKRTNAYVMTLDPKNDADMLKLETIRKSVSLLNKYNITKLRVDVKGRFGRNNPNLDNYRYAKTGFVNYQNCNIKDAVKLDVYIRERYTF